MVLDWEYLESRSEESLLREARWWRWRKLRVVVDFTSGTNLSEARFAHMSPQLPLTSRSLYIYISLCVSTCPDGAHSFSFSMFGSCKRRTL